MIIPTVKCVRGGKLNAVAMAFGFALLLMGVCTPRAEAGSISWTGGNSVNWSDPLNWTGGVAPVATDIAVFNNATYTNQPTMNTASSVMGIQIGATSAAITITTGATVSIGTSGIDMSAATANLTINCPVALLGAQSWNVASGRTLALASTATVANAAFLLTITGAGTETLGGAVSGTGGLTYSGTGSLTLSVANSYSGPTTISGAGTVVLGNATSCGTSAVTISAAATIQSKAAVDTTNTVATQSNFSLGGTTALTLGAMTLNAARVITNNNTTATTTFGAIGGATFGLTFSGNGSTTVSGIIGTTTGSLTKNGTGTLTLGGVNTFSGGVTHNGGTITVTVAAGLGTGTLTIGAANVIVSSAAALTVANAIAVNNAFTLNLTGAWTLSGVISGSATMTKTGASALTLTNTNTFTGTIADNVGSVAPTAAGSLGTGAATLQMTGGNLSLSAVTYTANLSVTASGTITLPSNVASATPPASNAAAFSGAFSQSAGTLTITPGTTGGSSLTLNGTTAISGTANIASNALLTISGTTVTLAGTPTFSGSSIMTVTSAVTSTATTVTQSNGTVNFNGAFTLSNDHAFAVTGGLMKFGANIAGSFNFGKSGAGTLTVEGTQSSATTPITVTAGTIGGAGTVASTLTVNGGTLAPGTGTTGTASAIGTFNSSNNVTFNTGSAASFQLGAPASNDVLNLTGSGVLNFAGATTIKLLPAAGFQTGTTYTIVTTSQPIQNAATNLTFSMPGYIVTSNAATATTTLTVQLASDPTSQLTWMGGASANLSTAGNWVQNVSPNSGTFELTFAGASPGSITNDLTSSVLALNFNSGGYTITGGTLTITSGGATVGNAITCTAGTTAISSNLAFTGAAPTITVSGGTLNATGAVNNGGFLLTVSDVGTADTLTGIISGTGGLAKAGAGTLTLGNVTNTYTGATTVSNGVLATPNVNVLANTSILNIQGASAAVPATFSYTGAAATLPPIDINLGANTGANIINSSVELDMNTNNKISGGGAGILALIKNGGGLFGTLTGQNITPSTFNGDTKVVAGTIRAHSNAPSNLLFGQSATGNNILIDTTSAAAGLVVGGTPPQDTIVSNITISGGNAHTATISSSNNGNLNDFSSVVTLNSQDVLLTGGISGVAGPVFLGSFGGTGNVNVRNIATSTTPTQNYDFHGLNLTGNITIQAPVTTGYPANVRMLSAGVVSGIATTNVATDSFALNGFNLTVGGVTGPGSVTSTVAAGSPFLLTISDGLSQSYAGVISNAAGVINLVKSGSGTQTLSGTNTFTGTVTVNGGTLALSTATTSNIASTSSITVASGGTLDVSAVCSAGGFALAGTQTLTDNGTLTGGVTVGTGRTLKGTGTVSGTATLVGTGIISPAGSGTIGTLSVGALTANAGTVQIDLSGNTSDKIVVNGAASLTGSTFAVSLVTPPTASTYTVLTATTLTGAPTVTGSIGRTSITLDNAQLANNIVQLDVTGFPSHVVFSPAADGTWNNTQSVANWTATDAGVVDTTHYYDGDFALFDDTNTGTRTVNLTSVVTPGSLTVNNSRSDYTFSGTGSIAGAASLVKSGTGALTISTTNTFSGGTTLSAGTINANAAGALGNGPIILNGGVLNVNFAGALNSNTITVNSGATLNLTVAGALTSSPIIVNAGGSLILTGTASATSLGTGLLTINGGTLDNTSSAAIVSTTNNAMVWGGSFTFTGTQGLSLGTGNVTLNANITLTVNGTVAANGLTVGGIIANGTNNNLIKTGTGSLTLSANSSTYTGTTSITGGTLLVNDSTTAGIFTTACALGASAADIPITNGKLQVDPAVTVTSLARTITFNNSSEFFLQQNAGTTAPAAPWTINAVDATPAIYRYITSTTWNTPVTLPTMTAGASNTLRVELNNGVSNGVGGDVILNAAAFPCKIVLAGVPGGNAAALAAATNAGRLILTGNVTGEQARCFART